MEGNDSNESEEINKAAQHQHRASSNNFSAADVCCCVRFAPVPYPPSLSIHYG